ncbi:hypothetical protein F8388_021043 [Cannabis sativa]|uniref:Adenosine deaminase domain-containing protein n=1 Tax=Cannabis sativa TaxID=3483 RepID=A0A7J6GZ50_CANSA|nr:hypothetical protein G4B88_000418 [Cannabis sativa]KAF4388213.1 hypothetical protein F8388_021043 [Cannabis sativa]
MLTYSHLQRSSTEIVRRNLWKTYLCIFASRGIKTNLWSSYVVEICLTSNIRTNTISSLDVHHFAEQYEEKHPLSLCTDDVGVFSTSLSGKYKLAASAFGLGKKELIQLAKNEVEFVFADNLVKRDLREMFNSAANKLDLLP